MEERSYVEAKLKPPKEIWAVKRCNEGITIKKCWILSHLLQHARLIPRQRPGLLTLDTPIRSLKSAKQMLIVFTVSKLKHDEDQAFAVVNHDHIPTFLKPVFVLCALNQEVFWLLLHVYSCFILKSMTSLELTQLSKCIFHLIWKQFLYTYTQRYSLL